MHLDFCRLAVAQTPITERASIDIGRPVRATRQVRLGHLDRDGVDVQALRAVDADRVGRRDEVQALERPQGAEVEDAAEVDVESLGALTGEYACARRRGRCTACPAKCA